VFTVLDEVLIDFGQLRVVAYGVLIISLFLWMPGGLIPTGASLWRRVRGQEGSGVVRSADSTAVDLKAVSGESQSAE